MRVSLSELILAGVFAVPALARARPVIHADEKTHRTRFVLTAAATVQIQRVQQLED